MGTITTGLCNSFKLECLQGVHVFGADIFKAALIIPSPTASFGAASTNYADLGADEVIGVGYTAGGATLAGVTASPIYLVINKHCYPRSFGRYV